MCGIVGYVGKKQKSKVLTSILKKLDYRGYDSAGICNLSKNALKVCKSVGKIENLERKMNDNENSECAILHTRWATNGKVCEENCHPHVSKNGVWAIVHNGIIENAQKLKQTLNFPPISETDTAVIAQGLEEQSAGNIFEFIDFFKNVEGGYAIVAMNKNFNNSLFLAKKKNPLFVAENAEHDFLVASDPICFNNFAKEYYSLDDEEFALIQDHQVCFFNSQKNIIQKPILELDKDFENADKLNYSTFMLKEIFEEDQALKKQVAVYKSQNLLEYFSKDFLKRFKTVNLIGCGTAYHACLIGAKYFQKVLNIPATAEVASEFCYQEPQFIDEKSLVILVSQSGETADTLKALEIAHTKGAYCLALTNVMYSSLSKKCDHSLPICAGVEVAVASTKAYICQVSALYLLVNYFSDKNEKNIYFDKIYDISNKILQFNQFNLKIMAKQIYRQKKCFFIGKDIDFITAREAALKINETTYISSCAYPSGELKHGYLALIEENTPIFVFATQENLSVKTLNSAEEAHSRGAYRILITNKKDVIAENVILLDEKDELLLPLLAIAPIQFLACEISKLKSINPDKPRHLAKSVTVE